MLSEVTKSANARGWPDEACAYGPRFERLLDVFPNAACTCDADGLLTCFNKAALRLWGRAPRLNDPADRFCGSFRIYSPDGRPITHAECPMALALRMNRPLHGRELIIERPAGDRITALAHANPFNDDQGNCIGAVNVLVDITERKAAEMRAQRLSQSLQEQIVERIATLRIMQELATAAHEARTPHVGSHLGHVIEDKRFERAITDALAKQQRDFGRELHDSVSQELTGIGMMAETLRQDLAESGSPHLGRATAIVEHLQAAHRQVRRLSRGLMPVEVDADGLVNALAELTASSQEMYDVPCDFLCRNRVAMEDDDTATHAYRIVQEAIHNAVKHGRPSRINVTLESQEGRTILTIQDNGCGFAHGAITPSGTGHRIMQYRAEMMGAELGIHSQVGAGTLIVCKLNSSS